MRIYRASTLGDLYIRNVNGMEDDGIEDFLGRQIEDDYAHLAQRIRNERDKFANIKLEEGAALLRFVASQAVRTPAHLQCVNTQAGRPVGKNDFLQVMLRQTKTMCDFWVKNPPYLRFFTTLPFVEERFIAGDSPVIILQFWDNPVWMPTDEPKLRITDLTDILTHPKYEISLPLSPYVAVTVHPRVGPAPSLLPDTMEPPMVRRFNKMIRNQSRIFILARDKESLN